MAARAAAIALMAIIAAVTAAPLAQRAASTTATDTPVGTPPVGMLPPLARHRRGGYNGKQCAGNPATYATRFGDCSTYAVGKQNHNWCAKDKDAAGNVAENVCSECGACTTGAACETQPDVNYDGHDLFDVSFNFPRVVGAVQQLSNSAMVKLCQDECFATSACTHFTLMHGNVCYLKKGGKRNPKPYPGATSGEVRPVKDKHANCEAWQRAGYCATGLNDAWIYANCNSACGLCTKPPANACDSTGDICSGTGKCKSGCPCPICVKTPEYVHHPKACVASNNIKLYHDKTVQECEDICDTTAGCVAFEYGVAHGGVGGYKPAQCQPQSSANKAGCPGAYYNLDLYVKQ